MLKVHVLDWVYRHSSKVAHGVEVPAGARLLFTNGQTGTRPDGTTPETAAAQAERFQEVLKEARMGFADVVRFASMSISPTGRTCRRSSPSATASWARTSRVPPSSSLPGWPDRN